MAVCSALINNGFDSSWRLYFGPLWPTTYWKHTTACLQHKPLTRVPQSCWLKQL